MARKPFFHDLPPIEEVFRGFPGFRDGQSRRDGLTGILRECARKLQEDKPRPFYPMRDAAACFGVSLRTVALSYETLDMEGLLHRMRGSNTMLAGKKNSARKPVNAVVGLPLWLTSMVTSPFECALQMELDERLRAKGYVADSIFYRTGEDCEPDFAERLLRHNLDLIIWQSPHPLSANVLMSLRERGVRLVLLQSAESPIRVPSRTYPLEWLPAYEKMAGEWAARGVRRVVIPEPVHLLARRAMRSLVPLLQKLSFVVETVPAEAQALKQAFRRASGPAAHDVLAFADLLTADALCNGHPDLIEKIASHSRLAFCRGPVRVPRLCIQRIPVDVVEFDPSLLAQRIVNDLCDPGQAHEGARQPFRPDYHPRILMKSAMDDTEIPSAF